MSNTTTNVSDADVNDKDARFKAGICPDCGDYMDEEFTPCDFGEPLSDFARYEKLVEEGSLVPA